MKTRNEFLVLKQLSDRIYRFLYKYADIRPDFDAEFDEDAEKYSSPDASYLRYCADLLSKGTIPDNCHSEWGSGGYKPYTSAEGKQEHDYLVGEIRNLITKKS